MLIDWLWDLAHKLTVIGLSLLVANRVKAKRCKKAEIGLKSWHVGTHLIVFGKSFPMNNNLRMVVF